MVSERVLQVVIRAKNEASKQLAGAEKAFGGIGASAAVMGGAILAGGAVVVATLNKCSNAASEYGSQVVAVQRLTGASAKESSQFAAMLDRVGVSGKGVGLVMKSVDNAIATNSKQLKAAGIATKDSTGKNRDAMSVVRDLAEYYANTTDKTKAVAVASKVLGRGYQAMLPILAGGAAGIDRLNKKAEESGLILGQSQIDAVKKYGAAMKDQAQAEKGLEVQIGLLILPIKTLITEYLTKFVLFLRQHLPQAIKFFQNVWAGLKSSFQQTSANMRPVTQMFMALWRNVLVPLGQFIGSQFKQAWVELRAAWATLWPQIKPLMPVLKKIGAVMLALSVGPLVILVAAIAGVATAIAWVIKWVAKGIHAYVSFQVAATKVAASLVNAGRNIVQGLWHGIKSQWDTLRRNVGGLFRGLVSWIRNLLGIHSPSAVFADIGKNLARGLDVGYTGALSPLAIPAFAGAGGGSFAPASRSGGSQEIRIFLDGRELSRALGRSVVHDSRSGAR